MLLAIAVLLATGYFLWSRTCKPSSFPPGPPRIPIFGSLLHLGGDGPRGFCVFHGIRQMVRRHGNLVGMYMGSRPTVVVSDLDTLRTLFKMEAVSSRPPVRPFNEARVGHELAELGGRSPGIVNTHGRYWRDSRRFALKNLKDLGFGKSSMEEVTAIPFKLQSRN
jgi:methyl farnesoate epoxidase/farnesoate epoxidase